MFPGLLQQSATINRAKAVGTNGRNQLGTLYTNVACLLIPMNHTTAIEQHFSIGRAYDAYMNQGQDVKPGDQLVINGNTYTVKVVQPYQVPFAGYTLAMCEELIS